MKPYEKLMKRSEEISLHTATLRLLEWDSETYMPKKDLELRGDQISLLSSLIHKLQTSKRYEQELFSLIDPQTGAILDPSLSKEERACVRELRRDFLIEKKLPASFVRSFSKLTAKAGHIWAEARKKSSFSHFAPTLEKIVSACRKKADFLGFQDHPYDALLDLYEPGMSSKEISPLFEELKQGIPPLLSLSQKKEKASLSGLFPKPLQIEFANLLLKEIGFEEESYRLDLSSHPFCSGITPFDTRMTMRIDEKNPLSSIFAALHEGGHGLYNQGLLKEKFGTPLGTQSSLGIDESQSRLWENWIGRSLPFWIYFYPKLQHLFPKELSSVSLEKFHQIVNQVTPSFIRVEADEVSYSLHVILRFEIEKELIAGTLAVKNLPKRWNELTEELLGISPPNDALGVLQDIHWSMGSFGYFPTYVLGNLYGAHLFETFKRLHPTFDEEMKQGNFSPLRLWLKKEIHEQGRSFSPRELIERVTKTPLSTKPFLDYLKKKCE